MGLWNRFFLRGLGAGIGMVLAVLGALAPSTHPKLSGSVLARVNGKPITRQDLAFALERLYGSRPQKPSPQEHQTALRFLIDQELLIQRGVEIGLLESDRSVRKALVMAVIDRLVAEVLKHEPTEDELRSFYEKHRAVFTLPARLHVQEIYFGKKNPNRAQEVYRVLAQKRVDFKEAQSRWGSRGIPLPDTLLPLSVLRRYLGPTLSQFALTLKVGEVSPPLRSPLGYHILRVADFKPQKVRPYEAVRKEVRAEYFRRARNEALKQHLELLRRKATLVFAPEISWEGERQ